MVYCLFVCHGSIREILTDYDEKLRVKHKNGNSGKVYDNDK